MIWKQFTHLGNFPPELKARFNSFLTTEFDDSLSVEMQFRSIIKWCQGNFKTVDMLITFINDISNWLKQFENNFDTKLEDSVISVLSEWQASGQLDVVISESLQWQLDDYIVTNEQDKDSLTAQLQQTEQELKDMVVLASRFKTETNTWGQAIQDALDYAGSLYNTWNDVGSTLYYGTNIEVKVPKGKYDITTKMNVPVGVDLDLKGVVFEANPADKSIDCFDVTGGGYRNNYFGGTFVGFKTPFTYSTNNRDVSMAVFDRQIFHMCATGIDTVSYDKSRSTLLTIKNCISWKTDLPIKSHTDMTAVDNIWVTHSGYDGPAIYNQGFTKVTNSVFVPQPAQQGARTRWIDNHSEDVGSTNLTQGERGIVLDHCRFGGEAGGMPVIFNYASHDLDLAIYKPTLIDINNSQLNSTGTNDKAVIVLFAMPNRIKISNASGMTNLGQGLIHADSTFDATQIPVSNLISIDLDESTNYSKTFPLMDDTLFRFLKRYRNQNDMFRSSFPKGFYGGQKCVSAGEGKAKFTFDVDTKTAATANDVMHTSFSLLVTTTSSPGGTLAYKNITTSIIHCVGGNWGTTIKRLSFETLKSSGGGLNGTSNADITSVHWGEGDTGSADQIATSPNKKVSIVFNSGGSIDFAVISIVPLFGAGL